MALTKVTRGGITADAVDGTKIADDAVDSEHYAATSVDNAHINDLAASKLTGTIATARLGSGTASSSTILYGDQTYKTEPAGFDPDAAVVFNDSGADVDFRVEGSGVANALFVQGSDGAVGVGTGSPGYALDVEFPSHGGARIKSSGSNTDSRLYLGTTGTTGSSSINFGDDANDTMGQIRYNHNGNTLEFKTDASEAMRLITGDKLLINRTADAYDAGHLQVSGSATLTTQYVMNTGFSSTMTLMGCEKGADSSWSFAKWYSSRRPDTGGGGMTYHFRADGNAYTDGTFNNNGADYAEYFESHTGSAIPIGTSVVLENNKVRAATSEDDVADIIGVARPKQFGKNSMVVGNTAWNMWSEQYLTDDFNCYVMEDYSVVSWNDEDGKLVTYESDNIPGDVTVPDDAETNTHNENGVKFQRRALNPDFDDSLTYEPREDRDEWVIVGLIGQVQILDGQPTNDSWIKMRDISDTVEEWHIR